MAMMKANGFIPPSGSRAKDSCFFVKLRRISLRSATGRDEMAHFGAGAFGFPNLIWHYYGMDR